LPNRVSLGKVALKASKIASVIFPSTQKTKTPDAIETNQAIQPISPVSVAHEKKIVNHNRVAPKLVEIATPQFHRCSQ